MIWLGINGHAVVKIKSDTAHSFRATDAKGGVHVAVHTFRSFPFSALAILWSNFPRRTAIPRRIAYISLTAAAAPLGAHQSMYLRGWRKGDGGMFKVTPYRAPIPTTPPTMGLGLTRHLRHRASSGA